MKRFFRIRIDDGANADDTVLNGRLLDGAAIGDQGTINLGRPHDACRQKARMGVDGCSGLVEVKFGIRIAQVEIRLEKRADRSDVISLLETTAGNLVAGMKWFQGTYTARFNARHRLRGHLFAGHYKAVLVERLRPAA